MVFTSSSFALNSKSLYQSFKSAKSSLQCSIRTSNENPVVTDISKETQKAYDSKDSKALYHLIRQLFGPQSSSVVPLKSKDGSTIHKDPEGIMKRWTEHFTDFFLQSLSH
jgi:hypothetical protein